MIGAEWQLVLSCEHASNKVPDRYGGLFEAVSDLLSSHRAFDIGAAELARRWSNISEAPLVQGRVSRLLIDLNRSSHHPALFSEFSRPLLKTERQKLLKTWHEPYRQQLCGIVQDHLAAGRRVLHLSLHSFAPVLNGVVRMADIGLLYDPRRSMERSFCLGWQRLLRDNGLRVRRNYPYRGVAIGMVTLLRRRFSPSDYIGIELEINQSFPEGKTSDWRKLQHQLIESFERMQTGCGHGSR